MNTHLILIALEQECPPAHLPSHVPVVYTGVGKINAALSTLEAINHYKPNHIINYGTVGNISARGHGLIRIERVIQRDMNAEPLAPRGTTPLSEGPHIFTSGHEGFICATGDSFVTAIDPWLRDNHVDVVDMELFAIASATHRANISWSSYKYITDTADENAADHWQDKVAHGIDLFRDELGHLGLL